MSLLGIAFVRHDISKEPNENTSNTSELGETNYSSPNLGDGVYNNINIIGVFQVWQIWETVYPIITILKFHTA